MAREYAQIRTSMSAESDWRDLAPPAQHLYLSLLTAPTISHCGVVDWRPNRIAAWSRGWTAQAVEAAASELERAYMVVFDLDTEEALIRSFIRNDGVMKQPRLAVSMSNAHAAIASRRLQGVVVYELARLHAEKPDLAGWKTTKGEPSPSLAVLEREAIDPRSLSFVYGALSGSFGPNRTQGLGVVSANTPAPTPTPAPKKTSSSSSSSADADGAFDEFWKHYPRKVAKIAARKAFTKALTSKTADELIAAAERYAADPNQPGKDEEAAIPHPATWLNEGRWDDPPLPSRLRRRQTPAAATRTVIDGAAQTLWPADFAKGKTYGELKAAGYPMDDF